MSDAGEMQKILTQTRSSAVLLESINSTVGEIAHSIKVMQIDINFLKDKIYEIKKERL